MTSVTPPPPVVPVTNLPQAPVEGQSVPAQVTSLPPSLQSTDRELVLRGEVQAVNQDGTVRIATPRGPIDVQLPQPLPARGQPVEVQIPAGTPPREVNVTLPQQSQTLPTPAPTPQPPQAQPPVQTIPAQPSPPQTSNPNQPIQTTPSAPAPIPAANTPPPPPNTTPAPPQTQSPSPPVSAQQPQPPQVSPQGLLDFLKQSLQTVLKTTQPATPNAPANTDIQQRPLQPGQMVRLTPLPPGQTVSAPATPALARAPNQMPVLAPSIPASAPATPGQKPITLPVMMLPQASAPAATTNLAPTLLNPAAILTGGPAPLPNVANDAIARILLPMMAAPITSAPAPATPGIIQTVLPPLLTMLKTPEGAPISSGPIIATPQIANPAQIVDVRVMAQLPSTAMPVLQTPSIATLLHGTPTSPVIFAQVTGQTANGLPVVEFPTFTTAADGTQKPATTLMVLQFPARALPPTMILKLDVLQQPASMSATTASTSTMMGDAITWDALDDVLKTIPGQPQAATQMQVLQAALPKPGGAAFTAPVLMFVAAMRGGDVTGWLGEKGVEAVKSSRRADAFARIAGDFIANARRADDNTPPSEWRSLTLPMLYGHELSRIQLHYRSFERDPDDSTPDKKTGTRFVMDVSLNRMGPLQIDGFSIGKKLDVTLRTEHPLSAPMREAMRTRYHDAVSGIGFAGTLHFSNDSAHKTWLNLDAPKTGETKYI